jgi:hypothetical protein
MPFPQVNNSKESALANYNYTDIAAGTGLVSFYAGNTVDLKMLSNQPFYSDEMYFDSVFNDGTKYVKYLDLDFDVTINRPLQIGGLCVINIPGSRSGGGTGGDGNTSMRADVRVRKWDGTTETDLAVASGSILTGAEGGTFTYKMFAIDLNIPDTQFKAGEVLRLTVEGWAIGGGSPNPHIRIGNDPMNRTAGWDTTGAVPSRLVFQVPQRIDL